jgi:hypothetical protein
VLGREFAVAGMSVCESDRSISAILPNRNDGRYLPDAVRVLAAQHPPPYSNRGALAARKRGLAKAGGRFVYFGATDDMTIPGLFATMLAALNRHLTAIARRFQRLRFRAPSA